MFTDDEKHRELKLVISGNVEKFATITPKSVRLNGSADQVVKETITIIPEEKYPFKILETKIDGKGNNITLDLKEVKENKGQKYLLTVQNLKKEKVRYYETINLKTDSIVQPEIKIKVYGNISDSAQKETAVQ